MSTRVTVKGQVTIPKEIRAAAGIKAGDKVEFQVDAAGRLTLQHADRGRRLRDALQRLQKDPAIKSITADEVMAMTRNDD